VSTGDLFGDLSCTSDGAEQLGADAVILRGFALAEADAIVEAVTAISAVSPFRQLLTPGGRRMSVAMTNAGALGWVSDDRGYRYQAVDPQTGQPWPALPRSLLTLAGRAAATAGFAEFAADVCLINRYLPGARMGLHQDRDEADFGHPIVSVSLGLAATFLFGGLTRTERPLRTCLSHGDVVAWGGDARLAYHGVMPLKPGHHPKLGACRLNLTFRRAG
jgi:alkylated DNA repair protein (DNA oxidative demethylase)